MPFTRNRDLGVERPRRDSPDGYRDSAAKGQANRKVQLVTWTARHIGFCRQLGFNSKYNMNLP
jgi:hypothetical protein